MTQQEKQLLLKDLSARLPYGVKINIKSDYTREMEDTELTPYHLDGLGYNAEYRHLRPYLRSMSSITKEELKELNDKYGNIAYFFIQDPPYYYGLQAQHSDIGSIEISEFSEIYDWLNEHMFDYCELIEKGLALEASEGMYKNEC